jgi:DNA polymerase-3 subunit chi|tara:strand:- start:224036 stop:224497 length:462 start_codon:yes stop_codon:yes gene_type:complete
MTDIRFYHLQQHSLDQALPLLLRKALDNGKRILVRLADEARIESLSDAIWSYKENGFIPHGAANDENSAAQPVLLTATAENVNKADMLVLTSGCTNGEESTALDDFSLCCEMFSGQDAHEVAAARMRWKAYKEAGHNLTYWQQTERGGWEKKA